MVQTASQQMGFGQDMTSQAAEELWFWVAQRFQRCGQVLSLP